MIRAIKKIPWFCVYALIISTAFAIRIWNVFVYNTWWADDGGAHIKYVGALLHAHRLPTVAETYLAWHEPGYYAIAALWSAVGSVFVDSTWGLLQWQELSGVFLGVLFVVLSGVLSYMYTQKHGITTAVMLLTSVLFVFVKISAYVTNELCAQVAILFLALLAIRWNICTNAQYKKSIWWGVLVGLLMYIKLTVVIVALAGVAVLLVRFTVRRDFQYLWAGLGILFCILCVQAPWLVYKQLEFGGAFSINSYEKEKQSIIASDAWEYILRVDTSVINTNPYWQTGTNSFISIALADMFSDHYNLFTDVDHMSIFSEIQTANGRYTSNSLFVHNLWMVRMGLVLFGVWLVGIVVWFTKKQKNMSPNDIFLLVLVLGGVAALLYNNIRHPYLDRGVLKVQFVGYGIPIAALLAYSGLYDTIRHKSVWFFSVFIPLFLYILVGLPVLLVG